MSDALQPDAVESLLHSTIGAPRLSDRQRERHLARLGLLAGATPPMRLQPVLAGATLEEIRHGAPPNQERSWRSRRSWAELAVVATVAVLLIVGAIIVRERADDQGEQRGVPAELVLAIANGLAPGEVLHAIVNIETDYRDDNSLRAAWSVESWRRVLPDGRKQEHYVLRVPTGEVFTSYTINGDAWALDRSGWVTTGTFGAGFSTISPQLGWSMAEPSSSARFLDGLADSDQVEIIQDERGEVYRLRSDERESFEQESRQSGLTINGSVLEMVRDPATGNVLETRAYLTSEEGVEITFIRATISMAEMMPADQIPNPLFELPSESAFPIYAAPQQLPGGLTLESHIDDFLSGSERLVYANEPVEMIVNVYPTRGGYDPRQLIGTRSDPSVVQSTETPVGTVTWVRGDKGSPQLAIWDDGRFYFELSIPGESTFDGWDVATLIAVVEALSSTP